MKEKQLENDALVAFLSAPDAQLKDYLQNGLTAENTQFLSADDYKNLPGIKKLFTDNEGVFNDDAFNKVYKQAESKYLDLTDQEALDNLLSWSPTSRYAPIGSKRDTYDYTPESGNNPTRRNKSITGLNAEGPERYTEKELAQMGKIWDSEKGEWRTGGSAESRSLWDKVMDKTLVYAKYTEDGEQLNPVTGQMEYHRAGEWMKDEDGNYFTRTINLEDLGKNEVVNLGDILTKEDSWWNKIDPLDSDERKKSLPGVIAKTAILSIPWLIPVVNDYYAALSVASGLVSLGATFTKAADRALMGQNNNGLSKGATAVENWFKKFNVGTSEENANSFFSLENLGQQMADIFGQLHQQEAVAKLANVFYRSIPNAAEVSKMSGEQFMDIFKSIEKRNELGATLSLGYMGLVSAADVYNDALNSGYDERTAGLTALASAGSLFGIMRFNETAKGLGTWFLKSTTGYDHEVTRQPVINCAKKLYKKGEEALNSALKDHNYTKINNFFGDFWANSKSWLQDTFVVGAEGTWKNMIVEGVEEVSEEAIQDMVKGVVDTLSSLGFTAKQGSFGGWSNVFSKEGLSRYLQTAAGGALGGGMFDLQRNYIEPKLIRAFKDPNYKTESELINDKDIVDLVLQGRSDELRKELLNLKSIFNTKKGATGIVEEDGTIHDFKANGQKTQADMIVDEVLSRVDSIEKTVESIVPRTYFGTLSDHDLKRIRDERFKFNGVDLEPVFFEDYKNKISDVVKSWGELKARKDADTAQNSATEENTEGSAAPKKKVDIKLLQADFDKKLADARAFFDPKQQAERHVLGKMLTSGNISYQLSGGYGAKSTLSLDNWLAIYYPNLGKKFSELEEGTDNDPDTALTQKNIQKQYDQFYSAWGKALTDPASLARRMRSLTKLYMNSSRMIAPIQQMTDLAHKVERMKMINEYKPADVYAQYVDQLSVEGLFPDPEQLKQLDNLSESEKEEVIRQRKEEIAANLYKQGSIDAQKLRLVKLTEIIQKNPFAFSARERINFDLAGALEARGILKFSDELDDPSKEVLKAYINQVAQDSGLVVFNKDTLMALQQQILRSFNSSDNLFIKALVQRLQEYNGSKKLEETEVTGDENTGLRKALIDLIGPTIEEWDLSKLDSDEYDAIKSDTQTALRTARTIKKGDVGTETDPAKILALEKSELFNKIYRPYLIHVLTRDQVSDQITDSELQQLKREVQHIVDNWNTLSFDEAKQLIIDHFTHQSKILEKIQSGKTVELAKLKGIEDLIGTDTVIDHKLVEQIKISLSGSVQPALSTIVREANKILPDHLQINVGNWEFLLTVIDKLDLQNVSIPNTQTKGDLSKIVDILLPSDIDSQRLYGLDITKSPGKDVEKLAKLLKYLAGDTSDSEIRTVLNALQQTLDRNLQAAQTNADESETKLKDIDDQLLTLDQDSDVKEYKIKLSDSQDEDLSDDERQAAKDRCEELEQIDSVKSFIKLTEDRVPLNNAVLIANEEVGRAQRKIEAFQNIKQLGFQVINTIHEELTRHQNLVKGKTVIDATDPVIEMMKNFYRIIHGSDDGNSAFEKILKFERKIRLSDVTGDTLQLSKDEEAALDDILETFAFVNAIIDGSVKWGELDQNTSGQNINEVWRNYEMNFGDKEKAKQIVILDPQDGITVQKYLADGYERAIRLKGIYSELNLSKSAKYQQFREAEDHSRIKLLKSDIIRRFHVFGNDDDEVDLLEGCPADLLEASDSAETREKLEEIVAQNLHKYVQKKKAELGLSDEEFLKHWGKDLVTELINCTDQSKDNKKITIDDKANESLESRLFATVYSWEVVDYNGDSLKRISIPALAMYLTELAITSPKERYDLLDECYKENDIAPRIDQENAILAIDFAVGHPEAYDAIEDAVVEARKDGGKPFKHVYSLFGTGGAGKTLLMQMLQKHYGDSKKIMFSALLQDKVDDLISASEKIGHKRPGKKLSELFPKLNELDQTFETLLIGAADKINEKLYGKWSTFESDTTLVNGPLDGDPNTTIEFKSMSSDKKTITFTVKSPDIEFEVSVLVPSEDDSVCSVSLIEVTKIPADAVSTLENDSVLFMDEITQLSPMHWAILQKEIESKNIVVIGAGDPVQKGWETKTAPKKVGQVIPNKIIQSMEKYNMLSLGSLYGAWRADNTSIQETVNSLYEGLHKYLIKKDNGNALFSTAAGEGITVWADVIDDLKQNHYQFTYTLSFQDEKYKFLGTYMASGNEDRDNVVQLMNASGTASKAIIINDDADISAVKAALPEGLKDWNIYKLSSIQGKEFDYTVLYQLEGGDRLQSARELFTALTRAKKGQLIITSSKDSDLFAQWEITRDIITQSNNIRQLKEEGRDNFAKDRAAQITAIANNATPLTEQIEAPDGKEDDDDDDDDDGDWKDDGFDPDAASHPTTEQEDPDSSIPDGMFVVNPATRGSMSADERAKAVNDTWESGLVSAYSADVQKDYIYVNGHPAPVGIGDWYTRTGISAKYIYGLVGSETYHNPGKKLTKSDIKGSKSLNDWLTELNGKRRNLGEFVDLYGFIYLLTQKVNPNLSAEAKVLDEFKSKYIRSKTSFELDELLDLFESFKHYVYQRSSEFSNIFFTKLDYDEDYDYAFRKINDANDVNPNMTTGIVFVTESDIPVYITTGVVNSEAFGKATHITAGSQINYGAGVVHKKQVNQDKIDAIAHAIRIATQKSGTSLPEQMSRKGGIYQVTSGVNLRFGEAYKQMNDRFGDFSYGRVSLKSLLELNYEILTNDQIESIPGLPNKDKVKKLFKDGVYVPYETNESDAKKDFIMLTDMFRWAGIDPGKQGAYEQFYNSRWILIRKKGQTTPTLVRVSYVDDKFIIDKTHFSGSTKTGSKPQILKKYKHRALILGILYHSALSDPDLQSVHDLAKGFNITKSDLKHDKLDDIQVSSGRNEFSDEDIFTQEALDRIANFKAEALRSAGQILSGDALVEFGILLDSYIARIKWNVIWSKYYKDLKFSRAQKINTGRMHAYLGVRGSAGQGLRDKILNASNYNKPFDSTHRSNSGISNLIKYVNDTNHASFSNYFYGNTEVMIDKANPRQDLFDPNKQDRIVVEYANEGTRSMINTAEYEQGLQIGVTAPAVLSNPSPVRNNTENTIRFLFERLFEANEIQGFYKSAEERKEFINKCIDKLVNLYTGKSNRDDLNDDDWKTVLIKFLGADSDSKDFADITSETFWGLYHALKKLTKKGDNLPQTDLENSFLGKFIENISDYSDDQSDVDFFGKSKSPRVLFQALFNGMSESNPFCKARKFDGTGIINEILTHLFTDYTSTLDTGFPILSQSGFISRFARSFEINEDEIRLLNENTFKC